MDMYDFSTIKAPWYPKRNEIKSVTISGTFTNIGSYSFEGLSLIQSITIPESIITIGNNPFKGCSSLTNIIFDSNEYFKF